MEPLSIDTMGRLTDYSPEAAPVDFKTRLWLAALCANTHNSSVNSYHPVEKLELGQGKGGWNRNNNMAIRLINIAVDATQAETIFGQGTPAGYHPFVVSVETIYQYINPKPVVQTSEERSRNKPKAPIAINRFGANRIHLHIPDYSVLQADFPYQNPCGKAVEYADLIRTNIEDNMQDPDIRPYIAADGYNAILTPVRTLLILEDLWRKIDPVRYNTFRRRS